MPRHSEIRNLPYTAEQMFDVVADVEHYPAFLPWCSRLDILARETDGDVRIVTAELFVGYHGLSERYVSRVRMDPNARTIEASHVQGPFAHLDNRWRFEAAPEGCRVLFFIDFAFKSRLLSMVAGVAFDMVARHMADAFVARAHALYKPTAALRSA